MVDANATRLAFVDILVTGGPPLTDQLLNRPPFKFLHDIISATHAASGFPPNLFTPAELADTDAQVSIDKAAKCAFLDKLIDAIRIANGVSLDDVKSAKIVAGKDADKTNQLLQEFAIAAKRYMTTANANTDITANGHVEENEQKKTNESSTKKSSSGKESTKKTSTHRDKSKDKSKDTTTTTEKKEKKKHHKSRTDDKDKEKKEKKPSKHHRSRSEKKEDETIVDKKIEDEENGGTAKTEDSGIAEDYTVAVDHQQSTKPIQQPTTSAVVPTRPMTAAMGRPMTSSGRPATAIARPAPPKMKRKEIGQVVEKKVDMVDTTNLIIITNDEKAQAGDDNEHFIIESDETMPNGAFEQVDANDLNRDEHGQLVRKILETKKELEQGIVVAESDTTRTVVFDESEREKMRNEIDKLQKSIQKLTQNSYPLMRVLDYLQEDIDSMLKELDQWRSEYRRNTTELRERQSSNAIGGGSDSDVLRLQLTELDADIKESGDSIAATKASILLNEQKIRTLIASIGSST